jgi:hypothetical protein
LQKEGLKKQTKDVKKVVKETEKAAAMAAATTPAP